MTLLLPFLREKEEQFNYIFLFMLHLLIKDMYFFFNLGSINKICECYPCMFIMKETGLKK